MDAQDDDRLAGEVQALLISVEPLLPQEATRRVEEFVDHAEYGVAVEFLGAVLGEAGAVLAGRNRADFRRLSATMGGLELPASLL